MINFNFRTFLILFIIVFLFLGLTGHLFLRDYFVEPDSYYHARMVNYLLENNNIPLRDPQAYYHLGGYPTKNFSLLWPLTVFTYNIVYGNIIQKHWIIYSGQLLMLIIGSLIVVSSYFFGKSFFGRGAGFLTAFLVATIPALTIRLQARVFESDNLGLLSILIGFIFFNEAFKQKNFQQRLFFLVVSSIFFGLTAWIWDGIIIIVLVFFIAFPIIFFVRNVFEKDFKKSFFEISFFLTIFFSIVFFSNNDFFLILTNYFAKSGLIEQGFVPSMIFLAIPLFFLGFFGIFFHKKNVFVKKIVCIIPFCLILFFLVFFIFNNFFLRSPDSLVNLISEERHGLIGLIKNIGFLMFFPLIFLLYPVSTYFSKKNLEPGKILLFCFLLFSFALGFYFIKYNFLFGFVTALSAGFILEKIFLFKNKKIGLNYFFVKKFFKLNKENLFFFIKKKHVFFIFLLFLFFSYSFLNIEPHEYSTNKTNFQIINAFNWSRENLPEDSSILVWWDYGHLASFFSDRKITNDNRNWQGLRNLSNRKAAEFFVSTNLESSFLIATDFFEADYVFVDLQMFQSLRSMNSIFIGRMDSFEKWFSDFSIRDCLFKEDCENFLGKNISHKIWFDSNETIFYDYEGKIISFNSNINSTVLAKLFFNSPEAEKYFEEVFSNEYTKIFKIKK